MCHDKSLKTHVLPGRESICRRSILEAVARSVGSRRQFHQGAWMVRFFCVLLVVIAALPAAVIRGTIFENRSGKPLSRVLLTLQPVAGTSGKGASLHSDRFGGFAFQ